MVRRSSDSPPANKAMEPTGLSVAARRDRRCAGGSSPMRYNSLLSRRMEHREPTISLSTMVVCLLASGSLAVAVPAEEAKTFDAIFQETQRLCDEYFLPNSMARPAGFDLDGDLRRLEAQLRDRATAFRAPRGVGYLRSRVGDATDDISRACARRLLHYLSATPANSPGADVAAAAHRRPRLKRSTLGSFGKFESRL